MQATKAQFRQKHGHQGAWLLGIAKIFKICKTVSRIQNSYCSQIIVVHVHANDDLKLTQCVTILKTVSNQEVTLKRLISMLPLAYSKAVCWGFCLFDLILYVPSTIFQLYRDGSSWVEPVLS